jgi:quinol monooxygenase YgiN
MGYFKALPDKVDELRRTYEQTVLPAVRAASGNVGAALFQQHSALDTFMVLTAWRTTADAEAYDRSGQAQEMVGRIRHTFAGPPRLETFDAIGL